MKTVMHESVLDTYGRARITVLCAWLYPPNFRAPRVRRKAPTKIQEEEFRATMKIVKQLQKKLK